MASTQGARARMSRQKQRDTAPELAVRRLLHAAGLRYRVNRRPVAELRRTGDIVFVAARVVVFIDGCFWHCCPDHATRPAANKAWWAAKLERNVARDRETNAALEAAGWLVLRFWEHEDPRSVAEAVQAVVRCRTEPAGVLRQVL